MLIIVIINYYFSIIFNNIIYNIILFIKIIPRLYRVRL